jgi:hypothetical protein
MSPTVKPMKRYHCASHNTPSFASRSFVADQSGDFTYPQLFGFCFLLVSKEIENNKLIFKLVILKIPNVSRSFDVVTVLFF